MADLSTEYGRATRIVVSGYDRSRVHASVLSRGEKRVLVVSIKGATPVARTIASARFQCTTGANLVMSNARLSNDKREAGIDLQAGCAGRAGLRCTLTLDDGDVMVQLAAITVQDMCGFTPSPMPNGPTDLTVTA